MNWALLPRGSKQFHSWKFSSCMWILLFVLHHEKQKKLLCNIGPVIVLPDFICTWKQIILFSIIAL